MTVHGTKFTIIGVSAADSGDAAANLYIPLQQAQTLADAKDKVTTVYVKAADSQQIDGVKTAIQKNITGTTVTTSADLADTVSGSLSTASDLASSVGKWLSIAVLIAAFLVAGLLTSSAVSRRVREFGTLKALGWKSGRVTRQVVGEALVNGLMGGVLGIAAGLVGAYVVTAVSPTLTAQLGASGGGGGGMRGGMMGGGGPGRRAPPSPRHRADRARLPLHHPDRRRPGRGGRADRGRLRRLARLQAAPRRRPAPRRIVRLPTAQQELTHVHPSRRHQALHARQVHRPRAHAAST